MQCKHEKCLTCTEMSNDIGLCLSCKDNYNKVNYTSRYSQYLDCMKDDDPKLKNFYKDVIYGEYRPCYKLCETCFIGGNETDNNCFHCKEGYMLRPGYNPRNNCVVFSEFYYLSAYDQYKALEVFQCPEEAKYRIKEKNYCTYDCKFDEDYKYLYNGNCVKNCPDNMEIKDNICIEERDECTLIKDDIYLKKEENFEVVNTLAKTYISEFNYTNKHISLYTNNEYFIILYKNLTCLNEVPLEMPKIDFKKCYDMVKSEYDIKEDLLISVVSQKGKNSNLTFFKFFDPISGIELEYKDICKEIEITLKENVTYLLQNENNTNLELQLSLLEQGIDIFDINNPFYKDICFDFDNPEKRDIPLSIRIEMAFPNISLCSSDCRTNGIKFPEKVASCDCSLDDFANKGYIKNNLLLDGVIEEALDLIKSSNILVVTCYKYIFKYFTRSIGGFIIFALFLISIINCLYYFLFSKNKMKVYILTLTERYVTYLNKIKSTKRENPPKKFISSEYKKEEKNKNILNNIVINNNSEKNNLNIINPKIKENFSSKLNNSNNITIPLKPRKTKRNKSKKFTDSLKDNGKLKQNESNNQINIYKQQDKSDKKYFQEYLTTSQDEMEFDDAIKKDKRKFYQYFIDNLKKNQMIAFTFISNDLIKIRVIRIILFILNIDLYLVIIGLFYSEEYITELYQINPENEKFFSFVPRIIDKLFYTSLVSSFIGYIVQFFFIEEKKVKGIFKREKDDTDNLKKEIAKLINRIVKSYLAFIILVFIIIIVSFYYILCFNYVYPKTQVEWIKGSVIIIIIVQILSVLKCLLQTSLRFLSFKINSSKIYKLSKIID